MKKMQTVITGIGSALTSFLGILAVPVLLMVACNVIDYITGLIASKYRKENLSSYKGIRGIIKKVCMWLLVVVGAIIDEMLAYAGRTVGFTMPFSFLVACVVAIWLVCNEILSILENMADIGVSLPPFLLPVVRRIKEQVEEQARTEEKEE